MKVTLPGFKTEERKGFAIGTQQSLVQDFTLQSGELSEQVTVTGEAPLVERSSATVASSLDKASLQNLPIFGRNAFYAAISTPGVIQSGDPQFVRYPGSDQRLVPVARRRTAPRQRLSARRRADHRLHQPPDDRAVDRGGRRGARADQDLRGRHGALGGRRVQHDGAFGLEHAGTAARCCVNKPGWATGQLYFAKKAGIANPPQYFRNWAGSIGGPIVKDRTFFWFSTDNYKQLGTRNNVLTLPTALERTGDFSQTRNAAGQLVVIYDPLTTRLNPATDSTCAIRSRATSFRPIASIRSRRAHCSAALPTPASGKSFNGVASLLDGPQHQQTLKVDQRWNDRVDDHRHVRAPEDARAGLGLLRRVRHDSRRSRRQPAAAHRQLLRAQQRLRSEQHDDDRGALRRQPSSTTAAATIRRSTPRSLGLAGEPTSTR